jgi:ferredoxin
LSGGDGDHGHGAAPGPTPIAVTTPAPPRRAFTIPAARAAQLPAGGVRTPVPRRFTITVEECGTATCTEGERVLVALERAQGFGRLPKLPRKLPVGCRRGGCGVCRVRVLDGEYRCEPMSRAHVSEADQAAGLVLSCSIYPLSDLSLRFETPVRGKDIGYQTTKT